MSRAILVDGEPVYCDATVRPWSETGLRFPHRGRRLETHAVVWHHTGGEGDGEQVHRVLTSRGLSVHFLIDQHGTIWQYADAAARCSHAGDANGTTVGVEISNRANARGAHPRFPRLVHTDRVHGQAITATRFLAAQVEAAYALAEALSRAYGLPLVVPRHPTGDIVTGALSGAERAAFRGHMGHYHVTPRKWDPGTELMMAFGSRWAS